MSRFVDPFPVWYKAVKTLLPISLALLSGMTVGLAIMGILPIPFAFGKIAWLPAIYKSLDTFKALAMIGGATASVSAIVGLTTSFVIKATILFSINERLAVQGQKAQERIDELERTVEYSEEQIRHVTERLTEYAENRAHRVQDVRLEQQDVGVEASKSQSPVLQFSQSQSSSASSSVASSSEEEEVHRRQSARLKARQ